MVLITHSRKLPSTNSTYSLTFGERYGQPSMQAENKLVDFHWLLDFWLVVFNIHSGKFYKP